MSDFEVLLASYPVFVVLRGFEGVLDWWHWLFWLLVDQVPLEEVVIQIHSQQGFGF